jgi:hypothetical protein
MKTITSIKRFPTTNFIGTGRGAYRFIVKCQAGFLICSEAREFDNEYYERNPECLMTGHKPGAVQTIQFRPEGSDYWLTIFAKAGKKIKLIDEAILRVLTVGTINTYWIKTELYCQRQYAIVNAKTWADLAYVKNTEIKAAEKAA